MKRTFWTIVLSLCCLCAGAQDRICTSEGTIIECRISDFERFDGSVSYFLPGTEGLRLITAEGIKYIQIGSTKMVRDLTGKFVPMNVRQSVDAPRIDHLYGVTGGYLTGFWSAGASYSWFFRPRSGIGMDLLYAENSGKGLRGIQILPRYEARIYIQRMGAFFVLQPGIGLGYYRSSGYRDSQPVTRNTYGIMLNVNLGLDIRLCRGLYLDICGRLHWEPRPVHYGGNVYLDVYHPHHSFGFMAGLRFGRER